LTNLGVKATLKGAVGGRLMLACSGAREALMRRAVAAAVDTLLDSFSDQDPDVARFHARAQRYASECGCASGGAFLIGAAVAAPIVLTFTAAWTPVAVLWSLLGVLVASLIGKLTGIAVATAQLHLLRRNVRHRTRMGVSHVHLH
jgi:hypothetical protein